MEFKQYDTFDALASYKEDWNLLLKKCASVVPFLTYDYLKAWWQTRGGGEWPEESQLVLVAAFEGEELVGAAPLFHAKNILGEPALMFVGAIEVSDFLDFIVRSEDLARFLSGLIDFLLKCDDLPAWDVLDLYNLLEESPSLKALETEAEKHGWAHQQIHLQPSPTLPLPEGFDAYLAGIDGKQRREIRRKLRNFESSFVDGDLVFAEDPDTLHDEVDAFLAMMAQDPNKRDFLTDAMRRHLHNTAQVAFEDGWLQLAFFTIDGEKAAANMAFNFNKRMWLYNSGWEWDFREYSPGWLLLTHLIQWATENGIQELDFMRGDEGYKYKFGGIDRHVWRVIVKR